MRARGPGPCWPGTRSAWLFLAGFGVAWAVSAALPPGRQLALLWWASTDVANLHHHPVSALIVSAFLPEGGSGGWVPLIALAMFGANRALGNARTALAVVAGHVAWMLVSEGIVAYRIGHGLPAADDRIMDVGPSYVIVSAIVVAVLFGTWPARGGRRLLRPPGGGRGHLRRAEHAAGRPGRPRHGDRRVPATRPAADARPGAGRPRAPLRPAHRLRIDPGQDQVPGVHRDRHAGHLGRQVGVEVQRDDLRVGCQI